MVDFALSKKVFFLCLVIAGSINLVCNGKDVEDCFCGSENPPTCQPIKGVTRPLIRGCSPNHTRDIGEYIDSKCLPPIDGKSVCGCKNGWKGDYCTERVVIITSNKYAAVLVPLTIIMSGLVHLFIRQKFYGGSNDIIMDPKLLVEPPYKQVSPKVLLVYRMICFAVSLSILIYCLCTYPYSISYFTVWNLFLLMVSFGLGSLLSIIRIRKGPSNRTMLSALEAAYWIIFEVEMASTIFVTVLVWTFLHPNLAVYGIKDSKLVNVLSIFCHGVNIAIFLGDFALNGLSIKMGHFAYAIVWGSIYSLFHGIWMLAANGVDADHTPVYFFFDMSNSLFTVWLLALLFFYILFFAVCVGVSMLKNYLIDRIVRGKTSSDRASEKVTEEEAWNIPEF